MKLHGHYDTLELRCEISGDFEHDLPSNVWKYGYSDTVRLMKCIVVIVLWTNVIMVEGLYTLMESRLFSLR